MASSLLRVMASASASSARLPLAHKRLFSASKSLTRLPSPPSLTLARRSLPLLSHAVRSTPCAPWLTSIRCRVNRSGNSGYAPLNSNSNFSDRPPTEMAPLFPGCDYEHWLIVMDKPGGEGASKQQMIDCYVQTLAKVLGSEEEAKKKIYNVSCERYFGFGCEIDEETSNKLEGLPGVLFVLPDSYVDPEYKDYGAELFVNGEIVQRSPERQKRVEPQPQRAQDRPRYNDRTRYVRRRENMSNMIIMFYRNARPNHESSHGLESMDPCFVDSRPWAWVHGLLFHGLSPHGLESMEPCFVDSRSWDWILGPLFRGLSFMSLDPWTLGSCSLASWA
ncbi:Multiple organellar RNA editing factor 2, chloroplastic, partial [Cucurbita argyrosperma subsp. sororia]